jgi:hypothetical protein
MQVEDGIRAADQNADRTLTLDEFSSQQAVVTSALTGLAPSRASIVSTEMASDSSTGAWNWRFIGLIGFNILLLAGLGWLVLRSTAS